MSTPTALAKVMIDAARKAGRALARDFGEVAELQVSKKGAADYVSAADFKAEQTLFEELLRARPGYGFLGEERGLIEGTDKTHTWIVDPLDGTTNFLHAMPHFAINIALQRDGEIVAGVTYNPATSDLFWTERGRGAFMNDRRLRVAAPHPLRGGGVRHRHPVSRPRPARASSLKSSHQVGQRVSGVRRFGSAALDLAWVAAGRFDGFWERDLNPWDLAAGILMVKEAGGVVTDADGGDDPLATGSICAANADLHPKLLERLKAAG